MKLLIIRHCDPDYSIDGLTPKGYKEVELLTKRLARENIDHLYCSPLGRARLTAEPTAKLLNKEPIIADWAREFFYCTVKPDYMKEPDCCWDILPEYLKSRNEIYDPEDWKSVDFVKESQVPQAYDKVIESFDAFLADHGYERDGNCYRVTRSNHETVALVCHFGITAVLMSRLLNCSPYSLWQNCVTAPSSVTTFFTEERRNGIASFRCCGMGDVSHLYAGNEPLSFHARFCECFTDDTRHD